MNRAEEARDARIARLSDRDLLLAITRDDDVTSDEKERFWDMRLRLAYEGAVLSKKQRSFAEEVLRRVTPILAADAPRGREVPTPAALQHLPERPLPRKQEE